jgi:hypothetical protein
LSAAASNHPIQQVAQRACPQASVPGLNKFLELDLGEALGAVDRPGHPPLPTGHGSMPW